jgi:uncharacterized protein YciI
VPLYLYFIEPARPGMPDAPTPEEGKVVEAHFAYLQEAYARGVVRYVGRTTAAPHTGLALFEAADDVAAQAFLRADPAVAAGVFVGRAQPFKEIFPMRT